MNLPTDSVPIGAPTPSTDSPDRLLRTYVQTDKELTHPERDGFQLSNAHASTGRIYMVEWPHFYFLKIGVTTRDRWMSFKSRGGVLRFLSEPFPGAAEEEARTHAGIRSVGWPQAFDCREAAVPFLGGNGSGWTECYRLGEPGSHRARLVAVDELEAARRARA